MTEALRSADLIEQCTIALRSRPLSFTSAADDTQLPIVSLQAQLPVIQGWLDHLAQINVISGPDIRWAPRLSDARDTTLLRLHFVMRSLRRDPPGPGPLNSQLAGDIQKFADALRKLRQLATQQPLASRRAH
ncbi:MAG TPA: hypothetical protein VGG16_22670 [Streptosporangiaceae bacterium]|jgi:hypothetical protein